MPTVLWSGLLRLVVAGVAAAAVVAVVVPAAAAATFNVTNTSNSGPGSFRQAVLDANLAPGPDVVSFSVDGTIRLTGGAVIVAATLEIEGPGADRLTLSGNGTSGILQTQPTTNLSVTGVTLADGSTPSGGGAIGNNGGTVTVENVVFLRNSAFAGGAIENANGGTLTIRGSTFNANTAKPGGAISNYASTLTVTNSTFVGNSAVVGGAIYNLTFANIRVTNSTFSGNTASGSGPALHNDGLTVLVENSLFADNGCAAHITDGGGNLDWPDSGCPGVNGDPRLHTLADNGGPTPTMALGAGSAAIDEALSAVCPASDQRGILRPFGAGCDIGAYESNVLDESPPVITVPAGIVTNATGPDGAAVSYSVSAVDDVDGPVAVTCVPPTGATFAIGTTAVACMASDTAGNLAGASFDVHVKGAAEQLADLLTAVTGVGPGTSLGDKVIQVQTALSADHVADACSDLNSLINQLNAQSGRSIPAGVASSLIGDAIRIRAVLGC